MMWLCVTLCPAYDNMQCKASMCSSHNVILSNCRTNKKLLGPKHYGLGVVIHFNVAYISCGIEMGEASLAFVFGWWVVRWEERRGSHQQLATKRAGNHSKCKEAAAITSFIIGGRRRKDFGPGISSALIFTRLNCVTC